jgi:hypothetical protein
MTLVAKTNLPRLFGVVVRVWRLLTVVAEAVGSFVLVYCCGYCSSLDQA